MAATVARLMVGGLHQQWGQQEEEGEREVEMVSSSDAHFRC
jgi:hypothetical protein